MTKTYSEKLLDPRWQKRRLQILERDSFTCKKCGDTETTLHIHHIKYDGYKDPWLYEDSKMDTLCADCHFMVSDIGTIPGFDYDKFTFFKFKFKEKRIFFVKSPILGLGIISYDNGERTILAALDLKDIGTLSNFLSE